MKITLSEVELPLKAPLTTAHGTMSARRIIKVSATENDNAGHSEAAPLPGFGLETYEEALTQLQRWAKPGNQQDLPQTPVARAAAAGALANLDAAMESITLTELLAGSVAGDQASASSDPSVSPASSGASPIGPGASSADEPQRLAVQALVSASDPEAAGQQSAEAAAAGHLAVKLKVGAPPGKAGSSPTGVGSQPSSVRSEIIRIATVRHVLPAAVALRLDANGGWDLSTASKVLRAVAGLDIDFVETPTGRPADWAQLARRTGARIAADEHLSGPGAAEALDQLIEAGAIEVAVLKPATVGGPQAAFDLACRASVRGVSAVVSSFMCGTDGLRIARDVALAVAPNLVHGIGTGALYAQPLAADVMPDGGYLRWSSRPSQPDKP